MRTTKFILFISILLMGAILSGCEDDNPPPIEEPGTVTDIDGNIYPTTTIGNQEWMAENLKTTKYRDGNNITFPGSNTRNWIDNTEGAYAWYFNDEAYKDRYGGIYNWYALQNPSGLCPTGWRVSTFEDWAELRSFLETEYNLDNDPVNPNGVANKLKSCRQQNSPLGGECATSLHPRWTNDPVHFGSNDYGFAALPGGSRGNDGEYYLYGVFGYWLTPDEGANNTARYTSMHYNQGAVFQGDTPKNVGASVRCIKE